MSAGITNACGRFKNLEVKNEILCPLMEKKRMVKLSIFNRPWRHIRL
jgi:hypothetical protein